jgi:DNA-binding transcriptional LysR family regulator
MLGCLAGAAWAGQVGAETVRVGGTGGPLEAMRLAGEAFHKAHPHMDVAIVPGLGSRGGIKALQAGAVDVAVSATTAPAAEAGLMSVELGRTPMHPGGGRAAGSPGGRGRGGAGRRPRQPGPGGELIDRSVRGAFLLTGSPFAL